MNSIPPLHLLQLRFTAVGVIRQLPHYPGAQWSAFFRHLLRPYLSGRTLADAEVWPVPVESGVVTFEPGDPLHVGLCFPPALAPAMDAALEDFAKARPCDGHFQPNLTLRLDGVHCRVSGEPWDSGKPALLTEEILRPELDRLLTLNRFTLRLTTPLRVTRPAGSKEENHRYCDEEYLFGTPEKPAVDPLTPLLAGVRCANLPPAGKGLEIAGGAVTWLDVAYGGKTIGGLAGSLVLAGTPSPEAALRLVVGQYFGMGKNAPFGFGYYSIPELDDVRCVRPLLRARSILDRALSSDALAGALERLPESSPGPDGLGVGDLRRSGVPYLEQLAEKARTGLLHDEMRRYRLPKRAGAFREIFVQNAGERLVHRSLAHQLSPAVDRLLSSSSYAYRRGLSRKNAAATLQALLKEGYTSGLKADIAAFFDSVAHGQLLGLLQGLFPAEPAIDFIARWLQQATDAGAQGLPQGGTLSPVLSNLYLDRFDRAMEKEGFRLVRFADDFVALFRGDLSVEEGRERIVAALSRLGLELREEKTAPLDTSTPIKFLGYLVSADAVGDPEREPAPDEDGWLPVFRDEWKDGQPIYLTTLCRGAYSSGADLVIRHDDTTSEHIPWSAISRLVVVGRSPFSGGVVYRAMREEIPVTFIDIMGKATGQLHAASYQPPELADQQKARAADPDFCLAFAREVIAAKINNSRVLLRRNGINRPELTELAEKALAADNLDTLRGYEGSAARCYFAGLGELVAPFEFTGRVYRPPDGPVNVMLSFGYTLLYNRIASTLRDKGLNPRIGFFHQGRGTHCALASDLQEELRFMVERVVLKLIHHKEVGPEDFEQTEMYGRPSCRMAGEGFRTFVRRYEHAMSGKFTVEGAGKVTYNGYLDEQADKVKRALQIGVPYRALRIR